MPAESKAQRRAMAIAEHHPEQLYPENKGLAKMTGEQLHEFAASKEKGLPEHKKEEKKHEGRGFGKDLRSHHGRHAKPRGG